MQKPRTGRGFGVVMDAWWISLLVKPFIGFAFVVLLFGSARLIALVLRPLLPRWLYLEPNTPKDAGDDRPLIRREP